jgi:hypothetical protein
MKRTALIVALLVAGIAALLWWRGQQAPSTPPVAVAPPAPAPQAAEPAAPSAVLHPIEAVELEPSAGPPDLPAALVALLGREAVGSFIVTDGFARRFVATVDNLGRGHAPPAAWPVNTTAGQFTVEQSADGAPVIAPANSARYEPLVRLATTTDLRAAVALYVRSYPQFQSAYEELGFPRAYFNDRLIAVIDLLLATPEAPFPPRLRLTEVKGPIPSTRPWVRYEFADPALEALAAGQKVLLRVGPEHRRRLQARLTELRSLLAAQPARRAASTPAR